MKYRVPKIILCLVVFAVFSLFSIPALAAFDDVPQEHPNYVAISFLERIGIVSGTGDGKNFEPDRTVLRSEALKMIFESAGIKANDTIEGELFPDVPKEVWFAKYVALGKTLKVIQGNPDGTFAPGRTVSKVEFVKMLLETYRFDKKDWGEKNDFADIPAGSWFAPYMNYAGYVGIIQPDENTNLNPTKPLSRGEVSEILYIMSVIKSGDNNQFLLAQAEKQITQIEVYIAAKQLVLAKKSSEMAVDMTQQALKNLPDNKVVLGAAKIARAYDLVLDAFIKGVKKEYQQSKESAELAITKATEAWEANKDTQAIARHIKNRANEVIAQVEPHLQ